jgi:hypothetical protein
MEMLNYKFQPYPQTKDTDNIPYKTLDRKKRKKGVYYDE